MCKETDDAGPPETNAPKSKIPKGLPEPGKIAQIPPEALVPPTHELQLEQMQPTIANQETFTDKELSSVSED
ncbi:hypothetical protein TVAGG3_0077300 [Trichomonas vaginalis G3]|uniref:hypothetical protein n=1 Tax=Trichomonas vaginalis (strain ATCC PRA-98 / G3) TaxID=412133 RepID=UPI0021E56042|nr:hypothetical protein TVAGG3_0077300 [Trichomonas vaginalis G3]KAI5542974.1 hypothetical protein TVAGG3_0077300 [Trichomonas vaginalis G3]